jgi:TIGR03009 family protein
MNKRSRSWNVALSFCLLSWLTASMAAAQQLGTPQSYPQQGAYSQQAPAPAAYPQTNAPAGAPSAYPQTATPNAGAGGQPNGALQQPVAAPAVLQVPAGFQLNPLEEAELTQVLDAWQASSSKITTFSCPFERHEYRTAFAPNVKVNGQAPPLNKSTGEISYSKPDKGSFEISEIKTFQMLPADPKNPQAPARGDWVKQPNTIGERWVCDGKSIYEFRSDLKQVIERQLPPHPAGESLLDGPLPFLFGAESAKLKQRYWMKIDKEHSNDKEVWLGALPKFQEQAANFSRVDVILDRQTQLPTAMQVTLPNQDRDVYVFSTAQAKVNGTLDRLQQAIFSRPQTPWGWKHVVDNMPMAQTPQQPATKSQTK